MKNAKHLLRNVAMLAVIAITCTSCNETDKTKLHQEEEKPEVLAPAEIVEINQAKSMYENYTERRVPLIQHYEDSINRGNGNEKIKQQGQKMEAQEGTSKPFDVARFVYYDYQTIKQYMDYIEQEADAAGVEISTLRFYFSNYPDEQLFPGTDEEIKHPRQNSVMLSPTIEKDKRDYLFYVDEGPEGLEAVILDDDFGTSKGMGLLLDRNNKSHASLLPNFFKPNTKPVYAGTSLTMNRGHGVPPYGNN